MSFLGISLGVGAVTAGAKIYTGIKQNKLANQINPEFENYKTSPFANKQLGLANNFLNGRMAGAADQERNILSSQSQFLNNIQGNATDSGQALALGGLSQGVTNDAFNKLGIREQENKYNMLDNLNAAYQSMINEGNKEYQSIADKYQSDVQAKTALRGAGATNTFSGFSDLGSGAFMANQFGLFGAKPYKYPTTTTP